ncbi:hypothetical protein B0H19DRAFT_1273435 [Mycena capillaripes]|nr:hypothetical protein B0H19DRAFT_1273435 [Mycena capillaripes]
MAVRYSIGNLYRVAGCIGLRKVLCLSQVSPYWRQIVHNAPQLWAEGVVSIRLSRELTDAYLVGLKRLITRSAPYPISISLNRGSQTSKNRAPSSKLLEASRRVAAIVVPTVRRWKNLEADLDSFDHYDDLPPDSFEALEKLYIRGFSEQTSPVTVFQSSLCLRNFSLNTVEGSKIRLIQLPCRTTLLQCSNLVSARFSTSYKWDLTPDAAETPVVVLPFLQTLILIFDRAASAPGTIDDGLGAFFMPLSLPSLTNIDFQFDSNEDEFWPTEIFSEFQIRSPKIENITLMYTSMDPDGLIALLRHGPSLAKLDIQYGWQCVHDNFFDALRYNTTDPVPVAPKLREMHLWCIGEFNLDSFEDAIRSRWWKDGEGDFPDGSPPRVSRLERVSIDMDDYGGMPDDLEVPMQDLIRQGLDLHVGWRPEW